MRNLGGSIGIAALSTFITFREQYHFSVIGDRLTQNSLRTAALVRDFTIALAAKTPQGAADTHMRALSEVAGAVRREAYVMAYSDCFFVLGIALLLCVLALFLIRKQAEAAAGH
jgi:MFS transporter, DHA2 family, multidrug resistance protein